MKRAILSLSLLAGACSPGGNGGPSGTGGASSPTGGSTTGGSSGSGGKTGSGGATQTGGDTGRTGGNGGGASTGGLGGGGNGTGGSAKGGAAGTATGGNATAGAAGGGAATGGSSGGGSTGAGITVQLDKEHQTIDGFGLNTALSSATVPWDTAFSTSGADGIGLSIVRVGMNPDGSLSGDVSGAKSHNVKVIGSTWTAPASWKDNNNQQKGGHLLTSYYEQWATRIATFAKNQALYAMGAANEPDFASCKDLGPPCTVDYDTMVYTANEMVSFIKVLGPKLKAANVKLIAPEPSEWIHLWSNTSATGSTVASHPNSSDPLKCGCFGNSPTTGCAAKCATGDGYDYGHWLAKDAAAWAAIDIIGTHEYDSQRAEPWPADVDGGKRSKPIYETEASGVQYWPEEGPSSDIKNGVAVAGWIHSALVVGEASGWLWWWYKASSNSDNEGLVTSIKPKRYYALGNYSKFVRPGSIMVDVAGNANSSILLSAFKGMDGSVILVAINKGTTAATLPITIAGGTAPASCTANVTSASDDLKAVAPALTVTAGAFTASLAATTITTFVCK